MSRGEKKKYAESGGEQYELATVDTFRTLRERVLDDEGWDEKHNKPNIKVWTKPAQGDGPGAGLNVVKINCLFPSVEPSTMYDALHDPEFRKSWDNNMIEGFNLVQLDERNDIGYYSAKFPFPLSNRDFLNKRSWMEFDNGEYIIMNHSVKHRDCPEKKGFVRAISIITGYYLRPLEGGGTELMYITHSDIKGSIPHALLNSATQKMAPSLMNNLGKNGENYPAWARDNHPAGFRAPWRTPKVSWDGDADAPNGGAVSLVDAAGGASTGDGAASAAGTGGNAGGAGSEQISRLQAELERTRAQLAQAQHRDGAAAVSLAPVAPRNGEDPAAVQQYRAVMQMVCDFVDRQFVEEGSTPTLEQYLVRIRAVLDGTRRTMSAHAG